MLDMSEVLEEYQSEHELNAHERLPDLEKLLLELDENYGPGPYSRGSVIEKFLADNPGAIEAILIWIGEQEVPEWRLNLECTLPLLEDDDE